MTSLTPTGYRNTSRFSQRKLDEIRDRLVPLVPTDAIAVTFGSYARREASDSSDLDYALLSQSPVEAEKFAVVRQALNSIIPVEPALDGAFATCVTQSSIISNLGGSADSNQNITLRMLLLLEGDWLANEVGFHDLRRKLLARYAEATPQDHQLALFLLNDVIRYWRTMTVDYAYKTTESEIPKPKAIRNLKLVFSRKLMYAGGLFAVGMTADRTLSAKVDVLDALFRMPVVERLQSVCGADRIAGALRSYDTFLDAVGDPTTRDHLINLGVEFRTDDIFRKLKNEAHHFTRELMLAFEATFHPTHPIRRSILF